MSEEQAVRLKRLRMRSTRRGIKEMDLILSHYAEACLAAMDTGALDAYERLLDENDHDLYQWVTGQVPPPPAFAGLIGEIAHHADDVARG